MRTKTYLWINIKIKKVKIHDDIFCVRTKLGNFLEWGKNYEIIAFNFLNYKKYEKLIKIKIKMKQ